MSYRELLRGKEETLLRIIHPNVLLLALLTEQDLLDECTEQALAAERTNFDRNRRLLEWLKHSPHEAATFDGFLQALRTNGQEHVANYIDGTPGDLPLRDDVRRRLRKTKAKLVEILYTNSELLDHLLCMNVINETDHQSVLAECTTNQRNARLIDILLRGSEHNLKCFGEALQRVRQGYVVDYLEKGEVLPVHIEVTSASQGGRELEEGIVSTLMKVVSMISIQDLPDGLSDDQRSRAAVLLQELQTMIVGARLVHSILLLCYMPTLELLDSVNATFMSGELTAILQQLFRCLTGVDDLTIAVSITAEDLQQCREALSHADQSREVGYCSNVPAVPLKFCHGGRIKAMSTSEPPANQGILTVQDEVCNLRAQVVGLRQHQQQTGAKLSMLHSCLDVIEADTGLSEAGQAAISQAKHLLSSCISLSRDTTAAAAGSWMSLHSHTDDSDDEDTLHLTDSPEVRVKTASSSLVSAEELARSTGSCSLVVGADSQSVDTGYVSYSARSLQGLLSSDSATSATGHYAMIHARRGKFIIISNTNFTSSATSQLYLPPQRSAEHDVAMLQDAFSRLGFDVVVHCNKTTLQMISIIAAAAESDHTLHDCIAVAVLSHGAHSGQVYGADGELVDIAVLLSPLKRCPSLLGKPKIVIVEAGLGNELDDGVCLSESQSESQLQAHVPLDADFVQLSSTTEGRHSWWTASRGSWFIESLCQELRDAQSSTSVAGGVIDVDQLLTRVRYQVAYSRETSSSNRALCSKKQIPCVYSTLTKQLHFPCLH